MSTQQTASPKVRDMTPEDLLRREFLRMMVITTFTDDEIAAVNRRLAATSTEFGDVLVALMSAYAQGDVRIHVDEWGTVRYDTSGVRNKVVA